MRLAAAYREAAVIAGFGLLLWLTTLFGGGGLVEPRPLIEDLPARIVVTPPAGEPFILDLANDPPLVRAADGAILGRWWPREARAIREALAGCRVVAIREMPDDLAAFGLNPDERSALRLGDLSLELGTTGTDRGFALRGDDLLVLDRDLGAWLARPAAALRAPDLGLDTPRRIALSDDAVLEADGRRWLVASDGETWAADDAVVDAWLTDLAAATVVGFTRAPGDALVRATLRFELATGSRVVLEDLGPAAGGGRLVRRSETIDDGTIIEDLVVDLDAEWLDPQPTAFRDRRLVPLAAEDITRLEFGELELVRRGQGWSVNGHPDGDPDAIRELLRALTTMSFMPDMETAGPSLLAAAADRVVRRAATGTRGAHLAASHPPHQLRDRRLVPDLDPAAVTDLIIQPTHGAPDIFGREPSGAWPTERRAAIEALLETIASGRVETWTASIDPDTLGVAGFASTLTLATGEGSYRLRLAEDGRVAVLERGLLGILDRATRRALSMQ